MLCLACSGSAQIVFSFEGDSISETNQNRWDSWFTGMMQAKLGGGTFRIWALSGDTASNMVGEYTSQAHTLAPGTNLGFFTLLAGINDLRAGSLASNVASNLDSIWHQARNDGYKVVGFTITPDYNQPTNSGFWQQWTNLNQWIETKTDSCDYIIPMASNILQSDLADGLHPNIAGSQKLALLASNVIFNGPAELFITNQEILVQGPPGNSYSVRASIDLSSWTNCTTNQILSGGSFVFTNQISGNRQFFQAVRAN